MHNPLQIETSKRQRQHYRELGKIAFEEGRKLTDCPYTIGSHHRELWGQGWWKAYYAQIEVDRQKIAHWLDWEVLGITSSEQANAIATLIVNQGAYDRTKPIENNRIGGIEFTIPAPNSL